MRVRYKIAVTIIPVILVLVVAMNTSFGLFFQSYAKMQEDSQIKTLSQSLSSFFSSEKTKYIGNATDWAHWDDTYNFMRKGTADYISRNLDKSTFDNLDINFFILEDNKGATKYKQYYSTAKTFGDFPGGFFESLQSVADRFSKDDSYGIVKLGDSYYFVAASGITDSLSQKPAEGKLIIGRQLDTGIMMTMAHITGCIINSLSTGGGVATPNPAGEQDAVLIRSGVDSSKSDIDLVFAVPNTYDPETSLTISMTMPRSGYNAQMHDIRAFSIINTSVFVVLSVFMMFLLGKLLSKPTSGLVGEIKRLDITKAPIMRLGEPGRDEFTFIRKSINQLIGNIEAYQSELVERKEELHATLVSVGDGVITADNAGRVTFMNPVTEHLTGWTLEEALDQPIETVFNIINEFTREPVVSPVRTVFERDEIVELANHTILVSRDGTERPIEDTAAPIKDASGVTKGCILVFRDFSERKERQRRIEYLSYHDQLTGLYNRRFFEQALKKFHGKKTLPLSFVYADINGLKIINDAFGHESGDMIIAWVAELFLSVSRPDDIAARVGGDEFAMLLPRTDKADVEALVERLKAKVRKKRYKNIDLSVSFGWDTKEELKPSSLSVLKNAEDFMYRKKILNNTSKRNGIIKSILHTLHVKCPREEAHSRRVSEICESIGTACGLNSDDIKELVISGELHDIGKIAVDEAILNKTEKLSDLEWAQIRHHPETGYRLLGATSEFSNIAEYVLSHHERWDGKGYPRGLKGAEICWKARVIAVADSYDAMTSDRPYRKALSPETAAEEIRKGAGTQFDPDIARIFVEKVLHLNW